MRAGGLRFEPIWVAVMLAAPVSAQEAGSGAVSVPGPASGPVPAPALGSASEPVPMLLAPAQGTASVRARDGERVTAAVRRSLEAHGDHTVLSQDLHGRALIACQTPECIGQALDAAGAAFAIVPAVWSRTSGGQELTLTLVQRSGQNLNATGAIGDDLAAVTLGLVEGLLARRAEAVEAAGAAAARERETETAPRRAGARRPHAWKAGPIVLLVGGAAAILAIGVGAGVRGSDQQLNRSAVAIWAAVGAAAIGAGTAWWVVGAKRRRNGGDPPVALALELGLFPSKIDLRLRF